ncbi:MAG: hypothetical protein ABUT39_11075 [Acidobacteriota bacterium]
MNRMRASISFLLFAAVILVIGAHPVVASTAGDSTNGHGSFSTGGSSTTNFVFDAKITSSSTVTGRARFFEAGGMDLDIVVTCLTISGNTAIIGGTDADDPSTTYAFKVIDNGGGATADRITLPQVNQVCSTFSTLGTFALTSGDVEVNDQP